MLLPVLLAVAVTADWVPARWASNDPKSIDLVAETPINCVLLEEPLWSAAFSQAARARGIGVLGVVRPGADAGGAEAAGLSGLVLEGDFQGRTEPHTALPIIRLPPRASMRLDGSEAVAATNQGVWPGIRADIKAAATGGPWIDTNSGFLRFVRSATSAPVWIANTPPRDMVLPAARYVQAIADAAIIGARWVVALDDDLSRRLLAREPKALTAWKQIGDELRFFEEHKDWRTLEPFGRLAIVQDPSSGALLSGGVLDMIAVKHTPVRPVSLPRLSGAALEGALMAVNVDPASLTSEQRETLKNFARHGGTLLTGPPGWKFPPPRKDQITLGKKELEQVDDVWRGINSMIGRTNLGARLFNVSGMLSSLLGDANGNRIVLHLLNYTNYPVESITIHMGGKYTRATLYAPAQPPRNLDLYPTEDGTGIDIDQVAVSAALVIQ